MDDRNRRGLVNHILYADDAILFCEASEDQVRYIVATLVCFECITGLKVNLHKSSLFPVGEVPNAHTLAELVGCKLESFPTTYLGLPLGAKGNSKGIWDPVIQSVERRVQSWKAKFLSFGGRIVLLKNVLSGLPIYFMSLLKAPSEVVERIERIQNRFLWAGSLEINKIHWIDWNTVKTGKARGGLGVHDLKTLNLALLSKWSWRYSVEKNAWWRELLVSKCGVGRSDWIPVWGLGSGGCSIWRWIISNSSSFWLHGYIDPGGGLCAFWLDYWVGGVRLCDAFPRIAAASQSLDSTISDFRVFVVDRYVWRIPLFITLRGGALREWNQLLALLAEAPEDRFTEGPASLVWPLESSGCFTVRSMRERLAADKFAGLNDYPSKLIWSKGVPTKVQGFIWLSWHKKIATVDNLQRRGMQLTNRCALCCKDLESVDHIFLRCEFAATVWEKISSKLSIYGPGSEDIKSFILAWKGMNCLPIFSPVMNHLLHGTIWFLWLERNMRIFKDTALNPNQVAVKILLNVGRWLCAADIFSSDKQAAWSNFIFDPG
ncbi:Putative ribonuclease H protein At1g65750 [Linum perenne]